MNDLLFDVPWWIPALLAVIGISLVVNGNKRQVARGRNAGIGVLLLGIGWSLMSYLVDTDAEKVDKQTHRLVKDVASGDWQNFKSQLMASASFTTKAGPVVTGADLVSAYAKTSAEMIHVTSAIVNNLTVENNGDVISAHFTIISTQDALAPYETSGWQFDWERTSNGWKVRSLELISIRDVPPDQLYKELNKFRSK